MEDSVLSRYVKSLMSKTIRQALGQPLLPSSAEQVDYVINAEVARWHTIGEFHAAQAATGEYHPIRQLRRVSGSEDDVGLSKIENSKLGWSGSNPLQLIFSNHHGETFDEREGYLEKKTLGTVQPRLGSLLTLLQMIGTLCYIVKEYEGDQWIQVFRLA